MADQQQDPVTVLRNLGPKLADSALRRTFSDVCDELEALRARVAELERPAAESTRILTCVYCGQEYPQDTPAHGDKILTDHIRVCEKHPLRSAEAANQNLRSALIGLVGTSDPNELQEMAQVLRLLPASQTDMTAMLRAIDALIAAAQEGKA